MRVSLIAVAIVLVVGCIEQKTGVEKSLMPTVSGVAALYSRSWVGLVSAQLLRYQLHSRRAAHRLLGYERGFVSCHDFIVCENRVSLGVKHALDSCH